MDDVLIVGAGPAGAVAATVLARAGARVRLLDRAHVSARQAVRRHGQSRHARAAAPARAGRRRRAARPADRRHDRHRRSTASPSKAAIPTAWHGRRDQPPRSRLVAAAAGDRRRRASSSRPSPFAAPSSTAERGAGRPRRGRSADATPHAARARRHRRRRPAFDARLRPRPRAPSRRGRGAGRSARTSRTSASVDRSARCTSGAAATSASRRFAGRARQRLPGAALVGRRRAERSRVPATSAIRQAAASRAIAARSGAARALRGRAPVARRRSCSARWPSTSSRDAIDGLLLAGDAAGFIDPMTGDGLRFAVRGGELAAAAALDALEHGWAGVHARLAAATRRREFAAKWRFNRALRTLVSSPPAVRAAAGGRAHRARRRAPADCPRGRCRGASRDRRS